MTPTTFTKHIIQRTSHLLRHHLEAIIPQGLLTQAMAYSVLAQGKCLRPQLVYLPSVLFNLPEAAFDTPACAIELIHAYSLIHDDLPAMDDASLRRGQPTCHCAFDEATAILAGDALQSLAFDILSQHSEYLTPTQCLQMTQVLARASGAYGMAAGQSLDLQGVAPTLASLLDMYAQKTGALLNAATEMGAIAAHLENNPLKVFTQHLGLAFQIQDDILDIESSATVLGKLPGIDQRNQKITYPSLTSVEASRQKVRELIETAMTSIPFNGPPRIFLQAFTETLMQRAS